ncbi:sugar ABC transporter ATP-binding protein [Gemmobacter serpentinus]|uniref:sugar ABC transporter ATP-binding protein n=1 Tax=Gemmobacter serpentinus TaxID=2652247 RepID=UPI00124F74F8|nr:sugar ABC transporter ATP-binding protein [Gemmobacter serpentinus]
MTNPVLRMRGIQKRFGPVKALDGVDFTLAQGEIHALLGTNGAGKSTLVKIISGLYQKDDGTIEIAGQEVEIASPADAMAKGIAAVQQHPELIDDLTGVENIFFGHEGANPGLFRRIRTNDMRKRAQDLLKRFPIDIDLDRPVAEMGAVDREIVAVLQALTGDHIRVLILDEPTSTLTEREKASLYQLMRALKEGGISIIYITHRLEEVFEIADRLTVFRGGRNVVSMSSTEARDGATSLVEHLLGEAPGDLYPALADTPPGEVLLDVQHLTAQGAFRDITLQARRGEILGVYGLVGSGLDELSKALFGTFDVDSGRVTFKGREGLFASPTEALKAGIFLVPGDRRTEGLAMSDDVVFNTVLANLGRASRPGGLMRWARPRRATAELAERLALQPPILSKRAREFSGGNQQKIVIAKGLYAQADLYIFVEPTVGVDIGAKAKLYAVMRELAAEAAVIVMSSDGDEVHGLADRLIGLYRGAVVYDAPNGPGARDRLLASGMMGKLAA